MGFSKGTLHYVKKNAKADKPFTLNAHVREILEMWGEYSFSIKSNHYDIIFFNA